MNGLSFFYIHKRRLLLLSLLALTAGSLLLSLAFCHATAATGRIARQVLRFHVIANSDSREDQALKLRVKETLLSCLEESGADSLEEMKAFVTAHQPALEAAAAQTIAEAGFSYPVRISLGTVNFPNKTYGDLTFPQGEYEALRVVIGKGRGQNWWCVLYPPLCFVDVTTGYVPEASQEELRESLTPQDYGYLQTKETVSFRFWLVDWFLRLFDR